MKSLYPNLDAELSARGWSYIDFAAKIGRNPMNVYRRLVGITQWTLPEVVAVCQLFQRSDVTTLFLRLDNKSQ